MTHQIIQKHQAIIEKYYQQINNLQNQHISNEQLVQWLSQVFNDSKISQQQPVSLIRLKLNQCFQIWVEGYLKEVCSLQPQAINNHQFKLQESIQFMNWLLQTQVAKIQEKSLKKSQIQQQYDKNLSKNNSNISQNKSLEKHQQKESEEKQHLRVVISNKKNNSGLRNIQSKAFQEQNQFSQDLSNSQPSKKIKDILSKKIQKQQPDNELKLPEQDERYKQYLQTIFQYYCKINFDSNKGNTFQDIQKNVSVMTMNKFMIFCNDFDINLLISASLPKQNKDRTSKLYIRNTLMDVFKKSSAFHKQMSLVQYIESIEKISEICFARLKQNDKYQLPTTTKYSYQMIKMLKYLQISNFKEFKQKMVRFNINFSLRFNKQVQQKKLPLNYKFKFQTEENKIPLSIKQKLPIQQNKIVLKDSQQNFNKPKSHFQHAKTINPKMSTPIISPFLRNQNGTLPDKKVDLNKNLSSNQKLKHQTSLQTNNLTNKRARLSLQKLKLPTTYEGAIEGYANIHLAKKGLLGDPNKNFQIGLKKKGEYQLNNVIEQARKQTNAKVYYDYSDSRSGRAMSNISASKPSSQYSRDPLSNQSYRRNRQDSQLELINEGLKQSKLNQKSMQKQEKSLKNSKIQVRNELENLIDFNNSDEDEYLDQHLKKQKQDDTQIKTRMQKKISSLNYKA